MPPDLRSWADGQSRPTYYWRVTSMLGTISGSFRQRAKPPLLLGLFITLAAFETATVLLLGYSPGGIAGLLDTRFFYTPEQAFTMLGSYAVAKRAWITAYLTWDTVNPILYASFIALLISWLFRRLLKPESRMHRLNLLPLAAGAFDLLENMSIVTLLALHPRRLDVIAWLGTGFTMAKFSLLVASVILVAVGACGWTAKRFRMG